MDPTAQVRVKVPTTVPLFQAEAARLMKPLQKYSKARLAKEMALSAKLADETKLMTMKWGTEGSVLAPALFAFTGIVYMYVDVASWSAAQVRDANKRAVILSGLYGSLRPLDLIAPYRLEMGSKFKPPRMKNLVAFWQERLTESLNSEMKKGEPIINLAAQEYVKALDVKALKGPIISPVFKEIRPDGSLKNAPVFAKMARGAMVKFIFTTGAKKPADLMAFHDLGWEASEEPPSEGNWLFTRPVPE
jgi:cytoplasmic iron level regulating protein YaaA (DUF328/UPF0246 family)